jgi:hypothetical protein
MVTQIRDDAIPFYVNGARPIPFGDRADVKCVLDNLVAKNLIILVNEPLEWAASLVDIQSVEKFVYPLLIIRG